MPVDKKNIFLSNTVRAYSYKGQGRNISYNIPFRDPVKHATRLREELIGAYKEHKALTPEQIAAIKFKDGIYLDFSGKEGHDLIIKSLENMHSGIRLLNVKKNPENNVLHATVYIPKGKESFFLERIEKYAETASNETRPNQTLINSIERIKLAVLESFWTGKNEEMPSDSPVWCEAWIQTDANIETTEKEFSHVCSQLEIPLSEKSILFPERMVTLIQANKKQLTALIRYFAHIAEFRRMEEPTGFFTDELDGAEQKKWVDELLSRTKFDRTDTSVCILDTGVNIGHPLLKSAADEECVQAVDPAWGIGDHHGHGTEVAGIALFYDLKKWLLSDERKRVSHRLESVKILPPQGDNKPELYGAITEDAIYLADSVRPHNKRAICMSVTSSEHNTGDGRPTSWSGAVDSIIAGVDDNQKRLFFISAGNVYPQEVKEAKYPSANINHSVESPGQAWNAITVGAYTKDVIIEDKQLQDYRPVAPNDGLSPYSSTSLMWGRRWPIKPDILCDGGNMATNGGNYTEAADLSLLTTHFQPSRRLFSTIHGTSSATAQAAWMAVQIMSEYPDIWPETVRALLIHSARWTKEMKKQFCKQDRNKDERRVLLRSCGYGIPNLETAIQCVANNVNLVIQEDLQPYAHSSSMNEMNIHKIPWPSEVLQELGDTTVTLRVTLSYFIDPGPGEIGWQNKYRYPSCGLRFDVINKDETEDDFKKRIDVAMRGEDKTDKGGGTSGSGFWYLGPENRNVGSIHSDFRMQYAVDLCNANLIAVYPVVGWWRERTNLKCFTKRIRYSLVVSIFTPETTVDFYTPIINQIETQGLIPIAVNV
jgi:hypothetical protein